MDYNEIIARARKSVVTETTYRLPEDVPIEEGWNPNDKIRPVVVEVKEFDDGNVSINVSGYQVKKDGSRKIGGASYHGVGREGQRRYEEALGFVRVPKS